MRAKYASAIRYGILKGRQTRYGDLDDPYYKLRSDIIWGWSEYDLRELAIRAFEHAWQAETATRTEGMSREERAEAHRIFERRWQIHTESRVEKQIRLLREEVQDLKERLTKIEQ